MEKPINRVGISWLYDHIKFDLINFYNILSNDDKVNFEKKYKEIDIKLSHLAKTFYLLNIAGGVFYINEFRLSLKYIVLNDIDNHKKIGIIADNVERIVDYIEDIIQGYGDLPVYYVSTIDELRAIREEILFSQCSYIVNSVKQHNISDFPCDFTAEQRSKITECLLYINNNYDDFDSNSAQIIKNVSLLKDHFKKTQHYLLWDLLFAYFSLTKSYKNKNDYIFNLVIKEILSEYNSLLDNLSFEMLGKSISNWIGTLSFHLLYSGYFSILDKGLANTIVKILNIPDKKLLSNYMAFTERMHDTDGWILILDIASELDIAISKLQESNNKRRVDINWLIELMQKHIDSCILTGSYGPLEHYYNAVCGISQYSMSGGFISVDDLETIEQYLVTLAQNVERAIESTRIKDRDHDDIYANISGESLANIDKQARRSLLKHQTSELEEISANILVETNLSKDIIYSHFNKITNIFKLINFNPGENIINLYLKKLELVESIESGLKNNIIVFIKYLTEILNALSNNTDYSNYIHEIRSLINNIELASIKNPNLLKNNNFRQSTTENITNCIDNNTGTIEFKDQANYSSSTLQQIFFEEFEEINENINLGISKWQDDLHNSTIIESIQREMHTLKGAARMVEFLIISDWVHHIEELLDLCQKHYNNIKDHHVASIGHAAQKLSDIANSYKYHNTPALPELIELNFNNEYKSLNNDAITSSAGLSVASLLKSNEDKQGLESNNIYNESRPDLQTSIPLRQTVRVSKDKLDELLDSACELTIGQHQLAQQNDYYNLIINKLSKVTDIISNKATTNSPFSADVEQLQNIIKQMYMIKSNYHNIIDNFDQNVNCVFNKLMNLRMVPLNAIRERLEFLVNSIASELGKKVHFTITKSEGDIDRVVLEEITPCIEHLLRNAIDHGIESPADRKNAAKHAIGKVDLSMYSKDQAIIIELSDNGAGIDIDKIQSKARELNLIEPNQNVDNNNLLTIISNQKFTSKEKASQISGRGIGLNVVKNTVSQLCGILDLETEPENGTKFTIAIPYSLTKQSLLFVKISDLYYALPSLIIEQVIRVSGNYIKTDNNNNLIYNNMTVYSLYDLLNLDRDQFGSSDDIIKDNNKSYNIIIINYKNTKIGCIVDTICETRESVVRPIAPQLRKLTEFMGGTIYQDGRVVLILDVLSIINNYKLNTSTNVNFDTVNSNVTTNHIEIDSNINLHSNVNSNITCGIEKTTLNTNPSVDSSELKRTNVLVIDDSATVRHAVVNYLSTAYFNIITAIDGMDALDKLKEYTPDLILLDIAMPRMNGLNFLKNIRNNEKFKNTPVIIMSSREEQAYKDLAMQLNVDVYLKKPYDQSRLINAINYVMEVD